MAYQYDMRDVFLKGQHVDLKLLTLDDVEYSNWYAWFNSEETTKSMQKHYFPNGKDEQHKFFTSLESEKTKLQLGIIEKKFQKLIGMVSIQNINFINQNAEISYIMGEHEFRKIYYTEEAVRLMIEHAFFSLNLRKLYGGTISLEWALFLTRMFGFEEEGRLKKHVYKSGAFVDAYQMALFRENYQRAKKE